MITTQVCFVLIIEINNLTFSHQEQYDFAYSLLAKWIDEQTASEEQMYENTTAVRTKSHRPVPPPQEISV